MAEQRKRNRKRTQDAPGRPQFGSGRTLRKTITITPEDYADAQAISDNLSAAVRMAFAALRREGEQAKHPA